MTLSSARTSTSGCHAEKHQKPAGAGACLRIRKLILAYLTKIVHLWRGNASPQSFFHALGFDWICSTCLIDSPISDGLSIWGRQRSGRGDYWEETITTVSSKSAVSFFRFHIPEFTFEFFPVFKEFAGYVCHPGFACQPDSGVGALGVVRPPEYCVRRCTSSGVVLR